MEEKETNPGQLKAAGQDGCMVGLAYQSDAKMVWISVGSWLR